jgi:hypothetical protein
MRRSKLDDITRIFGGNVRATRFAVAKRRPLALRKGINAPRAARKLADSTRVNVIDGRLIQSDSVAAIPLNAARIVLPPFAGNLALRWTFLRQFGCSSAWLFATSGSQVGRRSLVFAARHRLGRVFAVGAARPIEVQPTRLRTARKVCLSFPNLRGAQRAGKTGESGQKRSRAAKESPPFASAEALGCLGLILPNHRAKGMR